MSLRNASLALTLALVLSSFPMSLAHAGDDSPNLTQNFVDIMRQILNSIDSVTILIQSAIIHIARSVYSLMATAGFIAWISRYDRHLGRDLIFGSLMLAFFIESVLPLLA